MTRQPDPTNSISNVWMADNGDGTYSNPIIYADYSDPDVIRVGDDFYLTSSSFNCLPGLPILHSKDLVSWELIGYALQKLSPIEYFNKPQHGNGAWAPSIRYHNGEFYIYYGDPDFGIYVIKSREPEGPWDDPILVKETKGWIDPCPFWDDDGNAYLIHAFAGSRAGIKSVLVLNKMNPEGTKLLDDGVLIFDGHKNHPTIEGPKIYKRNGFYYIFAPAGGVKAGWQTVLRSRNIYGPYEDKIVMDQGSTSVNGPHQGAWVELKSGESWFIHFQDQDAYGRVVHLQPMVWINEWPVIGVDKNGDGTGEPVSRYKKPDLGQLYSKGILQSSDEFNSNVLGLQWQWQANPQPIWGFPCGNQGFYRLNSVLLPDSFKNLWDVPNLLLQKFPANEFTATTKVNCSLKSDGEKTGVIVIGTDYAYISFGVGDKKSYISYVVCKNAEKGAEEIKTDNVPVEQQNIYLRVSVRQGALCTFSWSVDGEKFVTLGEPFKAKPGKWIGAKIGLFCVRSNITNDAGYADIDWFRVGK